MRHKPACTLVGFLLAWTISIWHTPVSLPAQSVGEASVSVSLDDLDYSPASETIRLRNKYSETCYIESLRFRIRKFTVDERPKLVCQIFPFLDTIVVQVSNVGWGTYRCESLLLFNKDQEVRHLVDARRRKLVDLFDYETPSRPLSLVEDTAFVLFRMGPEATPFTFDSTARFDLERMLRPRLPVSVGRLGTSETLAKSVPDTVWRTIWTRKEETTAPMYKVYFGGEIERGEGQAENIFFLARRVPLVDLADGEELVARRLSNRLLGGLDTAWLFTVGSILCYPERRTRVSKCERVVGITVDLGSGEETTLSAKVDEGIRPGEGLEFPLVFLTSKSATFVVDVECSYRYGNAEPRSFVLRDNLEGTVQAPRTTGLVSLKTGRLMAALRTADPDMEERGRALLTRFLEQSREERALLLSNCHELRKLGHAICLAWYSQDVDLKRIGGRVVTAIVSSPSSKDDSPSACEPAHSVLFPLICRFSPDAAVELAIRYAKEDATNPVLAWLLPQCVCFDATHPHLRRHAIELCHIMEDTAGWREGEIALATVLKDPRCASVIVNRLRGESVEYEPLELYVWASTQLDDPSLNAMVASLLDADRSSSMVIKRVVESATTCLKGGLEGPVVRVIAQTKERGDYLESLVACLEYLKHFRTANADELLRELRDYPLRSEVRDLARELLGE